ncbi:MAG: hypothetical protein LBB84_11975 [Tannerellaceae bacterium]|jgi:hypothetical protein|nr:hypothetical protein [Tannerellaceae bacterium]
MKQYLFSLLFLLAALLCRAQEEETNDYLLHAGVGAVIYSGKEEAVYPRVREHPYLDTKQYREGTVCFDGRVYPKQQMRLNVYTDELIILLPDNRAGIVLPSERMDSAVFSPYAVFYHTPVQDEAKEQRSLPDKGYYARLHNGKFTVWKRQTKLIERVTNGMNIEQIFTSRTRYYVYKDGRYRSVGNKRNLLKLFASKKKELNLYIRQQRLNFKDEPDDAIVRTVKYYESLNP